MSTQVCTGSFVNVASQPFFIPLEQYVSEFRLKNLTQSDVTVGSITGSTVGTRIVEAFWSDYMNNGTAQIGQVGTYSGTVAPLSWGGLAANGITIFNPANQPTYAAKAISSFTQGTVSITSPASLTLNTTVWTTGTAHGYSVGDTVRVYSLTSAPQFGGLSMTVIAVGSTTTFTTLLNSIGATTSVGFVVKTGNYLLPVKSLYYPQNRVIAAITNTNPMYVTTLVQQNYAIGDVVTFEVPSIFGMPQLSSSYNGEFPVQATVVSVNNAVGAQTVGLSLNSTNYGVFATSGGAATNPGNWPLAAGYPFSFPYMTPQGEGNINNFFSPYGVVPAPLPYANQDVLSFATQNAGYGGVLIGAGTGAAAASGSVPAGIIGSSVDFWQWECVTSLQEFPQPLNPYYV